MEIVNPAHHICNLSNSNGIKMRVKVARGRGYEPADQRFSADDETRAIGRLQLDASLVLY